MLKIQNELMNKFYAKSIQGTAYFRMMKMKKNDKEDEKKNYLIFLFIFFFLTSQFQLEENMSQRKVLLIEEKE